MAASRFKTGYGRCKCNKIGFLKKIWVCFEDGIPDDRTSIFKAFHYHEIISRTWMYLCKVNSFTMKLKNRIFA